MIGNDVRHRFTVFQMALEIAILLTGIKINRQFLASFPSSAANSSSKTFADSVAHLHRREGWVMDQSRGY
jgi:hypothetical protein